jgi:LacI family transcriptional regulator
VTRASGRSSVTIYDIARVAGVSASTVSRALSGHNQVSAATRNAILGAAAYLGYRPNVMAQDLARGRSQTVGVLLPDTVSPFWGRLVNGIETELRQYEYSLLIASAEGSASAAKALDLLVAHHVDGLVVGACDDIPDEELLALSGDVPLVAVGRSLASREDGLIRVQNFEGAYQATQHLIALGHRRIAHVSGPLWHHEARERIEGFRKALEDAGIEPDDELVVEGDFSMQTGLVAVERLLEAGRPFTAVFASSDQMALGANLALYHRGLEVPRDVSLVGFDDQPFAAYNRPPLTTVAQPLFEMGQAAVRSLMGRLQGRPVPLPTFATTLCLRESTAARRSAAP